MLPFVLCACGLYLLHCRILNHPCVLRGANHRGAFLKASVEPAFHPTPTPASPVVGETPRKTGVAAPERVA